MALTQTPMQAEKAQTDETPQDQAVAANLPSR